MGASVRPESAGARIERNIAAMREQGANEADIEAYLTEHEGLKPEAPAKPARLPMAADATARRAPGTGRSGDFQAATNNIGEQAGFVGRGVAANVLNAAQGIPGMEALEAGAGALGSKFTDHPLSYRESRDALRAETEAIPSGIKHAERLIGGGVLAKALPAVKTVAGAAKTGAALGAADVGLNANPDFTIEDRAKGIPIGALIGGAVGGGIAGGARLIDKGRELNTLRKRVNEAPTPGEASLAKKDAIAAADDALYGAAESEAAANGGTSPAVQQVLDHPRIKPLADEIRESFAFQGKPTDDASIVFQLHRELSAKEGPLIQKITGSAPGQPITARHQGELQTIKELLRSAVSDGPDALAPSFRPAVAQHAEGMGEKGAMQEGYDRAGQLMAGRRVAGKKLEKQSDAATIRWAESQKPEKAKEALAGALGGGKEAIPGMAPVPWMLAGAAPGALIAHGPGFAAGAATGLAANAGSALTRGAVRLNRLSPFIDALDKSAGNSVRQKLEIEKILKTLGLLNAPLSNR